MAVYNPAVRHGVEGYVTNFALYVEEGGEWMLWDKVLAESQALAEAYFADSYPSKARRVEPKIDGRTLFDFFKKREDPSRRKCCF